MPLKRSAITFPKIASAVMFATTLTAAPQAHALSCTGARQSYFVGFQSEPNQPRSPGSSQFSIDIEGASAIVRDAGGYELCPGDGSPSNFSSAWSMIATGGSRGWAQSGIMRRPADECPMLWAEQFDGVTIWYDRALGCSVPGQQHRFWQELDEEPSGHRVRSNVDATIIMEQPFDPFQTWQQPFVAEFFEETKHSETNVGGFASKPIDFSSMPVQTLYTGAWVNACGNIALSTRNDVPARYGIQYLTCDHVRMWNK